MITLLAPCVFPLFPCGTHLYLALTHSVIPEVKRKPDVWCLVWSLTMPRNSPLKERNPITIKGTSFLHLFSSLVSICFAGCGDGSVSPTQNPFPCPGLVPGTLPTTNSRSSPSSFCGFSGRGRYLKKRKKDIPENVRSLQKIKINFIIAI